MVNNRDFSIKKKSDKDASSKNFEFADISKKIDSAIKKESKKLGPEEYKIEHLTDRIKLAKDIKENPPISGFMEIEARDAEYTVIDEDGNERDEKGVAIISYHDIPDGTKIDPVTKKIATKRVKKVAVYNGIFNIDLNVDAYFWFVRSCNVFPLILDQGIRTHLDIKKAHEPEKRKPDIPWLMVGLVITGIMLVLLIANFIIG